jgi:hypothetical protein
MVRSIPSLGSIVALSVLAAACGDGHEAVQLFSHGQARDIAESFRAHWAAGEVQHLLGLCRAPFQFRSRTWKDTAEIAKNLPLSGGQLVDEFKDSDSFEVFSYLDLEAGRWPRGENVPEAQRARRLKDLGVDPEGFVVRIYKESRRGVLLVLNLDQGARLLVQGVH